MEKTYRVPTMTDREYWKYISQGRNYVIKYIRVKAECANEARLDVGFRNPDLHIGYAEEVKGE